MELLTGKDTAKRVSGILHAKYQVHAFWVDLTVRGISGVDPVGRLDYGGGEYAPAGQVKIAPRRLRPQDNYQWWQLERGCYIVEFNESLALKENEIALLEPDPRTLRTGATHVSMFLRGAISQMDILFDVLALKLAVKQNARISRLRVFQLGAATEAEPLMRAPADASAKPARKSAKK
jgi:hypothetical protein